MQHSAEMQIYKEILDKMRQLMSMESEEERTGVEGQPFTAELPEVTEELGEAVEGEKAQHAEDEALAETEGKDIGLKEEMKKFFGGPKPMLPGKKGLKVGVTEIAVMPKPKKPKY